MWYSSLVDTALARRHIFWHATSVNRSLDFVNDIRASARPSIRVEFIDCRHLPLKAGTRDLDVDRIASLEADLVVVHAFDHLMRVGRGLIWMRQLRPAVQILMQGGSCLMVVSARPQHTYPQVNGSNLATDCYQATFVRPDASCVSGSGDHARALGYASGFVGVASALLGRLSEDDTANRRAAREVFLDLLPQTLLECGAETFAWLTTTFLYQEQLCVNVDDVDPNSLATIVGAGIGKVDPATDCLNLFEGIPRAVAAEAIQRAEDSLTEAPDEWVNAARLVFALERLVRRALATHLRAHPHAKQATLDSFASKVLTNFKYDTGIRKSNASEVPNPWKWVDLSDVLTACAERAVGTRVAGLSEGVWRRMAEDVIPIRNRVQHMRLPRPGDVTALRTHVRILRHELGMDPTERRTR